MADAASQSSLPARPRSLLGWTSATSGPWRRAIDRPAIEVFLIFVVFFVHAAWPVPEVNESHYLTKAKHYWNPQWCAADPFCTSADAHQVFYWTVGWLSRWLPLPAVAWVGRIAGWLLLAWSWRRMSRAAVDAPLAAVLTAALFVTANWRWHMAGEWVVGGIEAKVFAYAAVLLAWEAALADRWGRALWLVGLATALHAVVGGWAGISLAAAFLAARGRRPPLARLLPQAAVALALAMFGLVPALALNAHTEANVVAEANRIYVYERLPHHLLITALPFSFHLRFAALCAACAILGMLAIRQAQGGAREALGRLAAGIAASLALVAVGVGITFALGDDPRRAAGLLRFYWYRLADVMAPMGAAIFGVSLAVAWSRSGRPRAGCALLTALAVLCGWHLGDVVYRRQKDIVPPAEVRMVALGDWQKLCAWIAAHTPADAVFLTPYGSQTFRWYAGRAEVVNRKDIPQDAAGIVAWWERLQDVHRAGTHRVPSPWHSTLSELSVPRLVQLARRFGARYVVTAAEPRLPLPTVGPTDGWYIVYEIPEDL